jgi:hypothetical protein
MQGRCKHYDCRQEYFLWHPPVTETTFTHRLSIEFGRLSFEVCMHAPHVQ